MKPGIVVVGAGGHAKVCIELIRANGLQVDFAIGTENDSGFCVGVPILNGDANLERLNVEGYSSAFIAIGSNILRERLASYAVNLGFSLINAISPSATVSPTARFGSGIAVMAGAVVNADCSVQDLAIINTGATVDHDCQIGRSAHVAPQCALAGNVRIGDRSFLGIGTKVIPSVVIESDATTGAGSVVISDVAQGAIVVGVPARLTSKLKENS